MMKRRRFLQTVPLLAPLSTIQLGQQSKSSAGPIVISTWDFGKVANNVSWKTMGNGGTSLDAVEKGINVIESDPDNLTVGIGGLPDREGHVTLDACIMDQDSNCGSVMGVEHIVNVISVARKVMEKTPHVILVGDGALLFALDQGFSKTNLLTPKAEKLWREWLKTSNYQPKMNIENQLYKKDPMPGGKDNHDTIGLIAMDAKGNISGGCSTSGMAYKMRGRVGDSPVIGAGLFVDNEVGACTSTGQGEDVIRVAGSHSVVELMRQGLSPEAACKKVIERIVKIKKDKVKDIQVCFLAVNKKGVVGGFSIHPGFSYALKTNTVDKLVKSKSWF